MSTEPSDSDTSDQDEESTFGAALSGTVVAGRKTVIAVDAMGGDQGPAAVIGGVARAARANPDVRFLLFGPQDELIRLASRRSLKDKSWKDRVEIRHASGVISMSTKPSHAMRHGKDSSMWAAIDSVRAGEASAWQILWHRRREWLRGFPPPERSRAAGHEPSAGYVGR